MGEKMENLRRVMVGRQSTRLVGQDGGEEPWCEGVDGEVSSKRSS